ncbi:RNA-splicing ligase RtcB [Lujinxingia litoralis]|uniref:3'-phosphate/5'-hydroxy nucleic acid ligase n=1 Tax=Lujinxingia litoralis TaxID=2211119 RepID=A0A328C7L6_9DELT|nr:RtcB family protein [Lujinxingia litoralis]RAL21125.1 RNA-splicing ligase RtcB [Lujinxingia litoralis]
MKARELKELGIPADLCPRVLREAVASLKAGATVDEVRAELGELLARVPGPAEEGHFGWLVAELSKRERWEERPAPAPWVQWGKDLEASALGQMAGATRLPIAWRGALMADAHPGYGLPIGGVLATEEAVIPYAVGVDIACRVKLSVLDIDLASFEANPQRFERALEEETRFGIGANFQRRRNHAVMDQDWEVSPVTSRLKSKGWKQLGTSGSGNHFVEFGELTLSAPDLGLEAGRYLALLSHSGSRGVGAAVANHYSKLAMASHPQLPPELRHLAWLEMSSELGQEYWAAMELMGEYASANHAVIHREIVRHLGAEVLAGVENHHNYAWKEVHDGKEVIVHRKGATPAGKGVLGVIPGTMADPGYVVRGKGNALSLESSAHGAGRVMSRTRAKKTLKWGAFRQRLERQKVRLLSAGLDEAPDVYKNIEDVMRAQDDLVERVARFDPRMVKMAPAGEPAED